MGRLFNIDSPIMQFLGRITDSVILSFLWLICCLPIITIVPSTVALYYVVLKMARDEQPGVIKSFFHSLRSNMKQGIPLTIIFIGIAILLLLDYFSITLMSGVLHDILKLLLLVFSIVYIEIFSYSVALQAQFENTIKNTLSNAVFFCLNNPLPSIFILLVNIFPACVLLIFPKVFYGILPLWVFLAPSLIAYLCATQYIKIFSPYIKIEVPSAES